VDSSVIPGHHQSLVSLPEEVSAEVDRFKSALRKMYKKLDKVPVFFERNYRSQHLQVQVVPVAREDAAAVKKTFLDTASRLEVDLNEVTSFNLLLVLLIDRKLFASCTGTTLEKFWTWIRLLYL
jgi:Protein similar to CwfJ C-terminus 1